MKCQLDEAQAGIKIVRINTKNLTHAYDTTFTSEREEELNSLLIKVKEESEKADLKLNIQELKVMASSHIISWQIDGETMETVLFLVLLESLLAFFILGGLQNHCRC